MENEVMVYDDNVPAIADDNLLRVAEMAERRIDAVIKIKQMALKVTNANDWNDQGGKPYLQVSGSEKVANLFNISWRLDEPTIDTEVDGHFTYTMRGIFSIPGRSISCEGSRSSKDPFFKKYEWVKEAGNPDKVKVEKPISAIDKRDVRMAALTNLLGNGITRLLGIRNLSYDDLERYAGITKDMIAAVDYKGKGAGVSGTVKKKEVKEQGDKTVNDTLADELTAYCPDETLRPALLKQISAFKNAKGETITASDITAMSNKWAGTALGKLRELAKKKGGEEAADIPANCPKNPRECDSSGWKDGVPSCGPEAKTCPYNEVK